MIDPSAMDFSEAFVKAQATLRRAWDDAALGNYAKARDRVSEAAEFLIAAEYSLERHESKKRAA